jgi:hypothetical protein
MDNNGFYTPVSRFRIWVSTAALRLFKRIEKQPISETITMFLRRDIGTYDGGDLMQPPLSREDRLAITNLVMRWYGRGSLVIRDIKIDYRGFSDGPLTQDGPDEAFHKYSATFTVS